jgi:hypothetical protein
MHVISSTKLGQGRKQAWEKVICYIVIVPYKQKVSCLFWSMSLRQDKWNMTVIPSLQKRPVVPLLQESISTCSCTLSDCGTVVVQTHLAPSMLAQQRRKD